MAERNGGRNAGGDEVVAEGRERRDGEEREERGREGGEGVRRREVE